MRRKLALAAVLALCVAGLGHAGQVKHCEYIDETCYITTAYMASLDGSTSSIDA
jgi:hypothetical protein